MNAFGFNEQVHALAERSRAGDAHAREELQRELGKQLTPMVRRVVRTGHCSSSLDRKILQVFTQLREPTSPESPGDPVVARVAAQIGRSVAGRIVEVAIARRDTVAC